MNRREFSKHATLVGAAGLVLGASPLAQAQGGAPVEGTNYVRLSQRAPVSAPAGKIEVVEFFWYGCPHCHHFDPALSAWAAKLPADVAFRRVPVAFRENPFVTHQKLFYSMEAMGLLPSLHAKVFNAIHEQQLKLDTLDAITDYLVKQGVDKDKFVAMFNSFGMQNKVKAARALAEAYRIDGVPTMGIQGQYFTSISLNGSPDKTLATVNFLIDQVRKGK